MRAPVKATAAAALLATLLSLSACSRSTAPERGTVSFLIESMPANLDPRIGTDSQSQHLDGLLFSSLVAINHEMDVVPDLAETWEQPDPLTYIFHLRHDVRFHDGRPISSSDVKFTFDSILSGAVKTPKRGSFRLLASVSAPDDSTVVLRLREPYASFLWSLARPAIGIVPRDAGAEVARHPIGTGPFRFVSATTDEEVVLERNPGYFGLAPAVERVRFRIVPDATVRALELRKGTADIALSSLSPDTALALSSDPQIEVAQQPGSVLAYLVFNFDDPILSRREVRQALASATDRVALIRYLLRGQARLSDSLLPPNHWAFESSAHQPGYDPARAERLLDAAGYPRGPDGIRLRLTLKTSTDESARLLGAVLQDQWKRAGILLELRPLEFATFYSDVTHGSFQIATLRWIGANNDPDIFEYVFSSHKMPPDGANRGHYRNPALDALLDEARVESDRDKRRAILSRIQQLVAGDLPYLNLWYLDNVCVHRRRIAHVQLSPSGSYDFLEGITLQE